MHLEERIRAVQEHLHKLGLDGWLIYDFRGSNDIACAFLQIPSHTMLTRRFFYWIPTTGDPVRLVHRVEGEVLNHLPGGRQLYSTWQELEQSLAGLLQGVDTVAMEYSPRNALPTLSKVDAGTMELVRSLAVEVRSSADLLQQGTVWNQAQLKAHYHAADTVALAVASAWDFIREGLAKEQELTEYAVQQHIVDIFKERGCVWHGDPIVAVNAHAADPHYSPTRESCSPISPGDWILIDLWCKQDVPHGVYADICRVGVAASEPSPKQHEVFTIVKNSLEAGLRLVKQRYAAGAEVKGWEVDQTCRDLIEEAGYGPYFVHRTGHNIHTQDHGEGANIDNYETQDQRRLIPGTCFSLEPGIYLEGDFGVRLEYDVFIHSDGQIEVTGGTQDVVVCLM